MGSHGVFAHLQLGLAARFGEGSELAGSSLASLTSESRLLRSTRWTPLPTKRDGMVGMVVGWDGSGQHGTHDSAEGGGGPWDGGNEERAHLGRAASVGIKRDDVDQLNAVLVS